MGEIISAFFSYLTKWLVYCVEYIAGIFGGIMDAIQYYILVGVSYIYNPAFDLLKTLLDASGLGSAITTVNSALVGPLGYFANFFLVPTSITALFGAYLVRFFIRRLPIIG